MHFWGVYKKKITSQGKLCVSVGKFSFSTTMLIVDVVREQTNTENLI